MMKKLFVYKDAASTKSREDQLPRITAKSMAPPRWQEEEFIDENVAQGKIADPLYSFVQRYQGSFSNTCMSACHTWTNLFS